MPILPLPQFEADLAEQDREAYERLKPPSSVVAKFGIMGLIGEFPFGLEDKPGCGTKFVLKTHRGTEIGEMLTSTCPNSGCGKSISRKEMLEYIDRSGGKDYPFFSMQGKVLRIATVEDLNQQARIDATRPRMVRHAREIVERLKLPMKLVDAEPILGGEKVTFYFVSEERIDFREMVTELATEHQTRIEMRQVGSRDEARLTADYEKCGQHCCCRQFLKVLKPVSMKNAKIQKATLDPLKISGRCGRLMCCLRYEEQSYDDLRARLPKKRTRVSGEFGTGFVLDTQILTQLCLIQLDDRDERIAVPLEELTLLGPASPGQPGGPQLPQRPKGGPGTGPASDRADADENDHDQPGESTEAGGENEPSPDGAPPQTQGSSTPQGRDGGPRPDRPRDQRPGGAGGPGGGRPQWPGAGRPNQPQRGLGSAPGMPQNRGPGGPPNRGPGPNRPPSQPPPQSRPPAQPPREQESERDEIDDILSDMETDLGHHAPRQRPPQQGGGGPGGPPGEGGRRRKRRRRRGGGGPGSGGPGGEGGGPPPAGGPPAS